MFRPLSASASARSQLLIGLCAALGACSGGGGDSFAPASGPASSPPSSQALARCIDASRGQSFLILENLSAFQEGNPANAGQAARDPTGTHFLRLPAINPQQQAFFMTWQGQLIELNVFAPGPLLIGSCQAFAALPLPPTVTLPQYTFPPGRGVIAPNAILPIPSQFYGPSFGFSPPPNASLQDAQTCLTQSRGDKSAFLDCLVPKSMTAQQVNAYRCMRESPDKVALSTCLAGQMVGENEQRALAQAETCYRKHGKEYSKYPLCMAEQNFDPRTAQAVGCVQRQAEQGSASMWTVAGCVAGAALKLNPELTVALECAMSSGGEPMAFAGCTGGRLTAMELEKCFTIGVGGNGCFGDNNEIVKGLRAFGLDLHALLGPTGFVIQNWNNAVNDFQRGPGPNNDVVRTFNNINNDLRNGLGPNNDIRRTLTNIGLGGLF